MLQGLASLVVRVARDLLAFACDAGAPALACFLLPSASQGCTSAAALVAAVEGGRGQGRSSSLLHRALRSSCPAMVEGLLSWGAHTSYRWQVTFLLRSQLELATSGRCFLLCS